MKFENMQLEGLDPFTTIRIINVGPTMEFYMLLGPRDMSGISDSK